MANAQKFNKSAQKLAVSTKDSFQTLTDHAVGIQERNLRFAQGFAESYAKEIRHQAESNRALTEELVERAEKQRDAVESLTAESVDAYLDFAFAPLSFYKESLEAAKKATA